VMERRGVQIMGKSEWCRRLAPARAKGALPQRWERPVGRRPHAAGVGAALLRRLDCWEKRTRLPGCCQASTRQA
jgi:hypothetical protein